MEDAIQHVEKDGHTEGDATGYPSGVSGFQATHTRIAASFPAEK